MASARKVGTNESVSTYGASGQGRNYTALTTWEAATDVDMVTAATSYVLECYDDQVFTDSVWVDNGITSASYFRIIRPAAGEGHNGTPLTGVRFSKDYNGVFVMSEAYSQLQDITAIATGSASAARNAIMLGDDTAIAAVGCFAKGTNGGTGPGKGFNLYGNTAKYLIDCCAYDCKTYGIQIAPGLTGIAHRVYDCDAVACGYGFSMEGVSGSTVRLRNCLAKGNATADFAKVGTGTVDVDYCASSDGTADDFGGSYNRASQTFTFVDEANKNYALAATDGGAKNFGVDLSADAYYAFDDDIVKWLRTGSWDIGAFESPITLLQPAAASLTLTGQLPVTRLTFVLLPQAAALTLTGQLPGTSVAIVLTPQAAALLLTAAQPGLALGLLPQAAALDLTAQAPLLTQIVVVAPLVASLDLTAGLPLTLQQIVVAPFVAALTLTGQTSAVQTTAHVWVYPLAALLDLTAGTALVQVGGDVTALPLAAALSLTAATPGVTIRQLLLAIADAYNSQWTNELGGTLNLYASIDEPIPDSNDYAQSPVEPSTEVWVWKWQTGNDPHTGTGHVIRLRINKDFAGGSTLQLRHQLRQGYVDEGSPGTLIREDLFTDVGETEAEVLATLSSGEADAISDYANLYSRVVAEVAV